MKKIFIIFSVLSVAILLSGCSALDGILSSYNSPVDINSEDSVMVDIPKGSSTTKIANILKEKNLIKNEFAFKYLAKNMDSDAKMKAGEYKLSKNMSSEEIIKKLVDGDVYIETVKFTIPEGFNVKQIIERLKDQNLINEEKFVDILLNYDFNYKFLEEIDRKFMLEGFLFPDTYEIKKGDTELEIIKKMLSKFDKVFKDEYYTRLEELNMNVNQVITLASIIEREAKRSDEKARISGVFYNRLSKKMLLQSCATVQYALGEVKPVLYDKDLEIDSPFNTYKNVGLPPSPIASPGETSIIAALYPEKNDFLYFNTTNLGDDSHYFSKTYKEHLKNIKKSKENLSD